MTHYILAGGADRRVEGYGERLGAAVKQWADEPVKILSCQFSKPSEDWDEAIKSWIPWFRRFFGEETEVQLALPETFLDQVAWADIIYLHGGRTASLVSVMDSFPEIETSFKDKVVIGSSAGTNYLSKTYFSPKQDEVNLGSGIVPLNTIVHYESEYDGEISLSKSDWAGVIVRMKAVVGDEDISLIKEGDFIVFEK